VRILWIKTELLHPVDKGGKIRTYQMLRALKRHHHVTYLSLDDGGSAPDAVALSGEYAQETIVVPFAPAPKAGPCFYAALVGNLFSRLPYAVGRYQSAELRKQVARLAPAADLVVCDFLMPAVNLDDQLQSRSILFQHNVEAMIWKRHCAVPQNEFRRAYVRLQWRRMERFESTTCRHFAHVVAVSEADAQLFRAEYGVKSVSDVPTGVDLDYFSVGADCNRNPMELMFVGSMDWMPNDEGIRWFAAEVFSLVQRQIPGAKLTVVGRSPSAATRALATRNSAIEVTGTVPDVRPFLQRAALSVVPLRIGGGTRLKIYEAMAAGTPIVSTTIGAEGLPVRDGEHLRLADSPTDQAAVIVELLRQPTAARRLAKNALAFVERHCSWDSVAQQFISQCQAARAAGAELYEEQLV
jgi:glycosyltransferase involved in cell wall biosynthesis